MGELPALLEPLLRLALRRIERNNERGRRKPPSRRKKEKRAESLNDVEKTPKMIEKQQRLLYDAFSEAAEEGEGDVEFASEALREIFGDE